MPESTLSPVFTWPIRVYYEDTDAGGIVYHSNYLKFFERTRTEFLRALGFNQHALSISGTCAFVVADLSIHYRRPAKLDDMLTVTASIKTLRHTSFFIEQKALLGDVVMAEGSVRVVCIDPTTARPMAIPPVLYEKIQAQLLHPEKHEKAQSGKISAS